MKKTSYILLTLSLSAVILCSCGHAAENPAEGKTTKKERNFIKSGNSEYNDSNFVGAVENFYRALNINPSNQKTIYNIATAQLSGGKKIKQSDNTDKAVHAADSMIVRSDSIYRNLIGNCPDSLIKEHSAYNAGNIAYAGNDYATSIEMYKQALRINPDNDHARENLRLAQLKLQQQKDQDQGGNEQNNNNDQDNSQNEQNNDQQNKEQQQNDNNQQSQNNNQNQQPQQPQKPQPQKGAISQENAEKILKAMENAENNTRRKQQDKEKSQISRKIIEKPW